MGLLGSPDAVVVVEVRVQVLILLFGLVVAAKAQLCVWLTGGNC